MLAWILPVAFAMQAPAVAPVADTTPIVPAVVVATDTAAADTATVAITSTDRRSLDVTTFSDTIPRRRRAIEYSDAYNTRLTIHRIGSYTMLPLFAAEYWLGQDLLNKSRPPSWERPTHVGVALGLGALFTVNTVTGLWNLWDARNDPADRTRRYVHSALMLSADAGFAWAGAVGGRARFPGNQHKAIAISSMAISTVGAGMMWLWKN